MLDGRDLVCYLRGVSATSGAVQFIYDQSLSARCHSSVNNEIPQTGVFSGRF